jgi:hypothetical protein
MEVALTLVIFVLKVTVLDDPELEIGVVIEYEGLVGVADVDTVAPQEGYGHQLKLEELEVRGRTAVTCCRGKRLML